MPIKISQAFDSGAIEVVRADGPKAIDLNLRAESKAWLIMMGMANPS